MKRGIDCPDLSFLVHCEQGLGDTIQCVRYLPSLRSLFRKTTLLCRSAVGRLLELNQVADSIVSTNDNRIVSDCYIPLGSLPRWFHFTMENVGPRPPYLQADEVFETLATELRFRSLKA